MIFSGRPHRSAFSKAKRAEEWSAAIPWHLREFRAGDLDGNQLRVFYDFAWELQQEQA